MIIRILLISFLVLSCALFSSISVVCIGLGAVKLGIINLVMTVGIAALSGFIIEAHYTGLKTE